MCHSVTAAALLTSSLVSSCGEGTAPSPFEPDTGSEPSDGGAATKPPDPGPDLPRDPSLGARCSEPSQCNDGLDCTDDLCDAELGLCRYLPVHTRCQDDTYCDGLEQCVLGIGCREGEPVACSDATTCTIDRCVEVTRSCEQVPRDADGDGDPIWNCSTGTDCDDANPRIHGGATEICGNRRDDDCDGSIDEVECTTPEHDTCADPLLVRESGVYSLSLASAAEDMALGCVAGGGTRRDLVVALLVPPGPPVEIDLTVVAEDRGLALAVFADCSDGSKALACVTSVRRPSSSGYVARSILRGLQPGEYPLVVSGEEDAEVSLSVSFGTALPALGNETCGTARPLLAGQNLQLTLASSERDLQTACAPPIGEVVFSFQVPEESDLMLSVAPLDDRGEPTVSLRDSRCTPLAAELTCRSGTPAVLFARALPSGTYYAAVGATGPADVDLLLELSEPTPPVAGEGCVAPPRLENGLTQSAELPSRVDAVASSCLPGASDRTYGLTVLERSDVLLVERLSDGDTGAVSLLGPGCDPETERVCTTFPGNMVRARAYAVEPGEYAAVAESILGGPTSLTAMLRPAARATLVGLADSCEDAVRIEEAGGRFLGNTRNARADFEASCDYAGAAPGGAPDQMLLLRLSESRRVVLDMQESSYETLLTVRDASACPGPEVPDACALGRRADRSFLDLTLTAGEYWIQIDGFDGDAGAWTLDVFTTAL